MSFRTTLCLRTIAVLVAAMCLSLPAFGFACAFGVPPMAEASVTSPAPAAAGASSGPSASSPDSLEAAATRAGDTGRKIAMSLIGLGFAIAAVVLSFRRDFKEAAGVFAVGIVAVLLATPAGVRLLRDTVTSLFGAQ
jgi:hypothetical protein